MIKKAIQRMGIWLKRATGIGYRRYPPLSALLEDDNRIATDLCRRAMIVRREVAILERDLLHGRG